MRKESSTTSLPYSEARYFAIPASRSLRWPESFLRAAITIIWWAASTLVAISASLNAIASCWAMGLPKAYRRCA